MWRFDPAIDHDPSRGPPTGGLSVTIGVLSADSGGRFFSITLSAEGKELALNQMRVGTGARGHLYHAIRAGFSRLSPGRS